MATEPNRAATDNRSLQPVVQPQGEADVRASLTTWLEQRFGPEFVRDMPNELSWPKGRGV